jgi:hypothetical protein
LRAATQRLSLDTAGIFSETKFVLRTRAKQMARDASDQTFNSLLGIITRMREQSEQSGQPSPFAFLSGIPSRGAVPDGSIPPVGKPPHLVVNNDAPEARSLATSPTTPEIIISPDSKTRIL